MHKSNQYHPPRNRDCIDSEAFFGYSSLCSIIIPASVTTLRYGAVSNCSKLVEVVSCGTPLSAFVGNDVFANSNVAMKLYYYPEFSTQWNSIGSTHQLAKYTIAPIEEMFSVGEQTAQSATISEYTDHLHEAVIHEAIDGKPITAIGTNTFACNSEITTVIIPQDVTVIDADAFLGLRGTGAGNLYGITPYRTF